MKRLFIIYAFMLFAAVPGLTQIVIIKDLKDLRPIPMLRFSIADRENTFHFDFNIGFEKRISFKTCSTAFRFKRKSLVARLADTVPEDVIPNSEQVNHHRRC